MIVDTTVWMSVVILLPLAAAIIAFVVPRYALYTGVAGSGLTAAAVVALTISLVDGGAARDTLGGWGAPLGIDLVADGLSAIMLLMTAVVGVAITVYATGYFHDAHKRAYFWPLWLFLWSSLNALFLSGDIFNLFVTLELLGLSAVSLTALVGNPAAVRAAMRYLLVGLAGSMLYLLGVAFVYAGYGALDMEQLKMLVADGPPLFAAAALMTVGLMMKGALFPLHFWLPPAHANAAAPVSALLSALVVKAPFYILLRLWMDVLYPLADTAAPQVLSALGIAAIAWGSIQALRQPKFKLLVAYSTVAQLGYLFLLIPALLVDSSLQTLGAIVAFMVAHAAAKAAAFLSAGNVLHATGGEEIASFGGLLRALPLTVTTFALAGLSLVALPPSGGFIAKWLLLDRALADGDWWLVVVIIAGGLLAAGYVMRVLGPTFRERDKTYRVDPVPRSMSLSAFGLSIVAIVLGFVGVYLLELLAIEPVAIMVGGG